jgi:hypothetical protein
MSAANRSALPQKASEIVEKGKGKGKAANDTSGHDMSMEDDDDSSDEESEVEDVSSRFCWAKLANHNFPSSMVKV